MDSSGIRVPRRFGVVQRNDQDSMKVCKGSIPFVVILGLANGKSTTMDGKEGGQLSL